MDPNLLSAILTIAGLGVGWLLRHYGVGAPAAPPAAAPAAAPGSPAVPIAAPTGVQKVVVTVEQIIAALAGHFAQQQATANQHAALSGLLGQLATAAPAAAEAAAAAKAAVPPAVVEVANAKT